jgi:hypothetical protein
VRPVVIQGRLEKGDAGHGPVSVEEISAAEVIMSAGAKFVLTSVYIHLNSDYTQLQQCDEENIPTMTVRLRYPHHHNGRLQYQS